MTAPTPTTPFEVPGYVVTGRELAVLAGVHNLDNYPGHLPCDHRYLLANDFLAQNQTASYTCNGYGTANHMTTHIVTINQAAIRAITTAFGFHTLIGATEYPISGLVEAFAEGLAETNEILGRMIADGDDKEAVTA